MAVRHGIAAQAVFSNDLLELSQMLAHAVDECRRMGVLPHLDTAIQIITHQIAFAGNGDATFLGDYIDAYKECVASAPNTDFLSTVLPVRGEPS